MSLACISRLEPDAAEEPPHEKHQVNRFLLQQSSQAKDNKMTTIARLIAAMQQNYALIMDADKNPYDIAPPRSDSRSWSISPSCGQLFSALPSEFGFGMANSRISYIDSWHCCNGHDFRNCRSDTTARDED